LSIAIATDPSAQYAREGLGSLRPKHRGNSTARDIVSSTLTVISIADIVPIVRENIRRESRLMTDKAHHYRAVGKEFAEHGTVAHEQDEYVRGDIHSNTVENYYSVFKRGMKGVYQHCKEKRLHRYLAEFDFRYSIALA
jgi:hypothetical protein